jgi:hypothetical protein
MNLDTFQSIMKRVAELSSVDSFAVNGGHTTFLKNECSLNIMFECGELYITTSIKQLGGESVAQSLRNMADVMEAAETFRSIVRYINEESERPE